MELDFNSKTEYTKKMISAKITNGNITKTLSTNIMGNREEHERRKDESS